MTTNSLSPATLYQKYTQFLDKFQSALLLLIRLIWGIQFMMTGMGKWHDISKPIAYFTDLHIPFPVFNAYLVATTELVGGTFLLLGLLSRLTTIPLIISMIVAYLTTEQEALHALPSGNLDPFLTAAPFLFLFASILVLVFGPGKYSLDHLICKKCHSRE